MKRSNPFAFIVSIALLAACSSNGGGGASTPACGVGHTGVTSCIGGIWCQAGQYCDMSALTCTPGCTSDNNCTSNEFCMRASGAAMGACTRCVTVTPTDSGTPIGSGDCTTAVMSLVSCGLVSAAQTAAASTACNAVPEATRSLQLSCVRTAGTNCQRVAACAGSSPSDGGTTPGDGGMTPPGACSRDANCNTRVGIDHQICNGGFCRIGCRASADCGTGFMCEPSASVCIPE